MVSMPDELQMTAKDLPENAAAIKVTENGELIRRKGAELAHPAAVLRLRMPRADLLHRQARLRVTRW